MKNALERFHQERIDSRETLRDALEAEMMAEFRVPLKKRIEEAIRIEEEANDRWLDELEEEGE